MAVFYWALRALLSHWRRHPVQFFSVLTGLWLATALLTGVQALNSQARDSYARASQLIGGEPQASLTAPDGASFPQALFAELRRAGWPVSPVVQGRLLLKGHEAQRLQLMGIDPLSLPGGGAVAGQRLSQAQRVAFFTPPGRTWIAPQTLLALGLREGEQALTSSGQALPPFQVQQDMAPGVLLTDIGYAQPLLEMPGRLSRLLLDKAFAARLPTPPAALQLKQAEENNLARLTESFHLNLDALGFLSFVVGCLSSRGDRPGVGATPWAVAHLTRLWGQCPDTDPQPGCRTRRIVAAGRRARCRERLPVGQPVAADVAASLRGLYGAEVPGQLSLSPGWWLAGLGLSLFGALLAGGSSLWRATRLPLLALANAQAWHEAHGRWLRRQGWVAGTALVIALLALWLGDSLAAGFVLMATLLLGAALGLPVLLNGVLTVGLGRSRAVLGQWFLADCRQQLPA